MIVQSVEHVKSVLDANWNKQNKAINRKLDGFNVEIEKIFGSSEKSEKSFTADLNLLIIKWKKNIMHRTQIDQMAKGYSNWFHYRSVFDIKEGKVCVSASWHVYLKEERYAENLFSFN